MKRTKNNLIALATVAMLSAGILIRGVVPLQAPSTGTWAPTAGSMSAARAGAASVLLPDGRVLIAGGCSAGVSTGVCSAPLASAEFLNADGNFYHASSMNFARSGHTATLLQDGRVLVAGGADASGSLQTAEIYDPGANTWTAAGLLMAPRSGHTATLLQDGTVLIAGGSANGAALNSLELFDPSQNTFKSAPANLSSARQSHAAALLSDGRVLIMGGWDGTTSAPVPGATTGSPNVLASSDIYDPASGTVAPGPAMSTPRMNFTATVELDGKVAALGGSDGQKDLASLDVFDPAAGSFAPGGSLTTARSNHLAFLLPHNANILVVGGTSSGTSIPAVEMYCPWTATSSATGSMTSARSGAVGSPLYETMQGSGVGIDGTLMVAGGSDASTPTNALSSSEVYGFATIKSDKPDYQPGDTVTLTGSGWTPGETVTLTAVEVPFFDTHGPWTAVADSNGNISDSQFVVDSHDLDIRFYLTATGSASQAQTAFADGTFTVTVSKAGNGTGTVTSADGNINCGSTCTHGYTAAFSTTLTVAAASGSYFAGWSGTGGCTGTGNCVINHNSSGSGSFAATATFTAGVVTTTILTSTANPSVIGQSVTFTATVAGSGGPPAGTVTFMDGATILGTGMLSGGVATFSTSALTGVSHSITAVYGGGAPFGASTSNTVSQVVNKADTLSYVTSTPNASTFGASVSLTAAVSAVAPGTGTPTGTVQFKVDGTNLGTAMTLVGGSVSTSTSSLSATTQGWGNLAPTGTAPASGCGGPVVGDGQGNLIFFGGGSSSCNNNGVFVLSHSNGLGGTPAWTQLSPAGGTPTARHGEVAAYDPTTNSLMIFSGCTGSCLPVTNDVWVLTHANGTGGTPAWTQLSPVGGPPSARQGGAMAYDPTSNRLIIFSGQNGGGSAGATSDDLWVLTHANGTGGTPAWSQLSPTGGTTPGHNPPGQYTLSSFYDAAHNRLTVSGGLAYSSGAATNAVWVLTNANGTGGTPAWTNLIAEGAAGSPTGGLSYWTGAYDPANNRGLLQQQGSNDVWAIINGNGLGGPSAWANLNPSSGPSPVASIYGTAYDSAHGVLSSFFTDGSAWEMSTGVHSITATYVGDSNFNATGADSGSTATALPQTVNPAAASKLVFTTSAFSAQAGACSSQITVQTQDSSGNPAYPSSAVNVALSSNSGTGTFYSDSGCASPISSVSISTSANSASFYSKDTKTGSPVITATASGGVTSSPTQDETVTAGTVNAGASTVGANPTSVVADGSTTSTITVTLLDSGSNPVSGKTVTLAQGTGSSTISAASGASNASGIVTFTVKDTKAETVTYTATDSSDSVTITQTAAVTFTAGPANAANSTVIANPASLAADGTTTSTITVTLKDVNNNPASGKTVTLGQGGGSSTISAASGPSDANGVVTFTVKDTKAETVTYTATDTTDSVIITQKPAVTFNPGPVTAGKSTLSANPTSVTADGATTSTITVTLLDANSNPVSGKTVTLAQGTGSSSISAASGLSSASGVVTFTVKDTKAETVTYTATDTTDTVTITQTAAVTFTPGPLNHFTFAAIGSPQTAGTAFNITITAQDANNNTVTSFDSDGNKVNLTSTGTLNGAPITSPSFTSGVLSNFSVTITNTGTFTITATGPGANPKPTGTSNTFMVNPGAAAKLLLSGSTANLASGITRLLTATIEDANNNTVNIGPDSTLSVAFTQSGGTGSVTGLGSSPAVAGVATLTVTGNLAGSVTIGASATGSAGVLSAGTGNPITFSVVAGPAAKLLLSGSTADLASGSTRGLTATIEDVNGNIVTSGGDSTLSVTFTQSGGTGTVTGLSSTAAVAGIANLIVTGFKAGPVTIGAAATGSNGALAAGTGNPITFNVVAGPLDHLVLSPSSATITAGGSQAYTAEGRDANNNSLGDVTGATTFSNSPDGSCTGATCTATVMGPHTVTGTDSGKTGTASLTVTPGALDHITLSPASATITAGGSAAYTAAGFDQYNNSLGDVTGSTTYTVTNGSCTLNSCTSTVAGSQTVTGNDAGKMANATLQVNPGPTAKLVLNPLTATITAGGSQVYTAEGVDSFGNPTGDLTASTTFSISPDGTCDNTAHTCTTTVADVNGSSHTVTGNAGGPMGTAALTVNAGNFTKLQLLVPGESATPGVGSGKTGTPGIEYVNGAFNVTVNAVDDNWNLVNNVTDTVHFTSSDGIAKLPTDMPLAAGTGSFSVTLETPENPAATTITAADQTDGLKTASTSAEIEVIVVYTATISPTDWATGQQASYTLTVNNAAAPNTNNLASIEVAVPAADQGTIGNPTVTTPANWSYDASHLPGTMRFFENTGNDAVAPGGTITITFTATSSAPVTSSPVPEVWNTTAFSDAAFASPLPLAWSDPTKPGSEPTVNIGAAPAITSGNSTTFTYGASGTFTVTTSGVPTPTLSENGADTLPGGVTFNAGTGVLSGTPTAAGTFTLHFTAHNGYGSDATQTFTLTVNKATVTPSITADDKTYDGGNTATVHCTLAGVLAGDIGNVTCAGTGTFGSANAGTGTVTSSDLALSGSASGNYMLSTTTATATAKINPKPITATLTAADKTYDGTNTEPDASMSCSLTGVLAGDSGNVSCSATSGTFNTSQVSTANLVTATATISGTASGNYTLGAAGTSTNSTSATATAHIKAKPITATLTAADKTYDGTNTEPDASMSCSLTGVLAGDSGNVSCAATSGTFNTSQVSTANLVTATATISGTASGNYTLGAAGTSTNSTSSTTTAHIKTKPVTASLMAHNKTYDGTNAEPDGNMSCMLSGVLAGDTGSMTCTASSGTFDGANVGSHTVTATATISGAAAGNYTLGAAGTSMNSASETASASITTRAITATLTAGNKTYDGTNTEPDANMSCTLNGVLAGDAGGMTCTASSGTFDAPNVGSHTATATATISGAASGNYTLGAAGTSVSSASETTSASITTRAITATLMAHNKTYDGTSTEPDANMSCTLNGVLAGDVGSVSCTPTSGTFDGANVGSHTVTATATIGGAAAGNYTLGAAGTSVSSASETASASITTRAITATLTAGNKTYDGTNVELNANMSCSLNGVLAGDVGSVSCTPTSGTFDGANVGSHTVTATATIGGAAAGNYTLGAAGTSVSSASETASASITTRAITATLTAGNKTYDGTNTEPDANMSCSLNGVLAGDAGSMTCTASSGTFDAPNVGSHTVTATATMSGAASGNYTLGAAGTSVSLASETVSASITTRAITATLTAHSKTYDGTSTEPDANMSCTLNGVLAGDAGSMTCTASNGTFDGANVGSHTVTATATMSGAAAGNYTLGAPNTSVSSASETASANITTRAITATLTAGNKTFDGTNAEPNSNMSCSLNGVLAGDAGSVSCTPSSGTFNTSQVTTANLVTATVTISGAAAGNYTLGAAGTTMPSTTATASAKITPASTSTAVNSSLNPSYFGNLVTFTATVTNTSDSATPTGSLVLTVDGSTVATGSGSGNTLTATYSTSTLLAVSHPVKATYANTDGNFGASGPASLNQVVNPVPTVSTVTVTPLYYNPAGGGTTMSTNPPPARCPTPLNANPACQQYSDLVNFTATLTPDQINNLAPATSVTFFVGTQNMGTVSLPTSDSGGTLTWTLANVPLLEPSAANGQMAPGNHSVTAVFGGINPNFTVVTPSTTLKIVQEDAQVTYTGLTYFGTSTSATTMDVTVSFTLQDATATGTSNAIYDPTAGNITKAAVAINLTGVTNGLTGGSCSPAVVAVSGEVDPTNGLPSTGTVSCTISNVSVPGPFNLSISPGTGSYYTFMGDVQTPVTTANGGTGFITGGGFQTAAYLGTPGAAGSGKYITAGLLKPAKGTKMNYGFETKYNKNGSNLQGGANIIIRSGCVTSIAGYTPAPGDDGLCVYQIKTNGNGNITSLTESLTAPKTPNSAVFTARNVTITDVTWPTVIVLPVNLTLQLNMYDVADPGANADTLGIQINDSTNGLWFANNWSGVKNNNDATVPVIQGGNLQVH